MRIGLIAMSGVRVRTAELAALGVTLPGFVRRGRVIASLPSLGLLTVAGLTPPGHEVTYLEVDDLESLGASARLRSRRDLELHRPDRRRVRPGRPLPRARRARRAGRHPRLAHARRGARSTPTRWWSAARRAPGRASWRTPSGVGSARVYTGARERVFEPGLYAVPRFDLLEGRPYNRVTVQSSRGCPARLRVLRGEPPDHVALQPEAGGSGDRRDPRRAAPRGRAVLRAGRRQHASSTGAGRTSSFAPSRRRGSATSPRPTSSVADDPGLLRPPRRLRLPAAPDRLREPAGGRPGGPRSGRVEAAAGAAPPARDRHAPVARA